jgi:membrane-associated protease RseP (regulator of RpoE activity)
VKTKRLAVIVAVLLMALPLAAAMPDGERVERVVVRTVDAGAAGATAEDAAAGSAPRAFKVVVVGGEGDGAKVLEDVLVDTPHHRVIRIAGGAPGEGGERIRMFHAGAEGGLRSFAPIEGRGFLGVHLIDLTPELRAHFGAGDEAGLLVGRVEEGSPAEQAGLRVGDLLTRVGGEAVSGNWDVVRKVRPLTAGQGVALEVVREGRVETLSATVAEREPPQIEAHALLRRLGEDGETRVWQVDPEELRARMGEVTEIFADPEWREKIKTLTVTGEGLHTRLQEMEREIQRLEKELADQRRE